MKILKFNIISAAILVAVAFSSCTEEMDINLDSTYTRLVVDGLITTDTTSHYVRLAKSASYFYNQPLEAVSNARVTLSDGTNSIELTESTTKPGYYYTPADYYGVAGKTYSITIAEVDIDDDKVTETYSASSYLHPLAKADSIALEQSKFSDDIYEVMFYGQDPAETHDYYLFKVRRNGVMVTDTLTEASYTDDEMFNGKYVNNVSVGMLNTNKTDEDFQVGDTITLEFSDISHKYFIYLNELFSEANGSSPFGGQSANISTNIEGSNNKAIGFFTAYAIDRLSYKVKQSDLKK
jgi:hypothetical protein